VQQEATRRGWIVAQVYTGDGHSGAAVSRPALDRLRLDALAGAVDAMIVAKTNGSRVGRLDGSWLGDFLPPPRPRLDLLHHPLTLSGGVYGVPP